MSLKIPLMQEPILWQILECCKIWDLMAKKKYTDEYGETAATSLRYRAAYHCTWNYYNTDEIRTL